MPEDTMFETYADDFKAGFELNLQQMTSKFRDAVSWAEPVKGRSATIVNFISPFEVEVGGDDLQDTVLDGADTNTRWAFPVVMRKAVPVTNTDLLSSLSDPSNALVKAMWAAHRRGLDDHVVIPAFFRDVVGGIDKDQTISFPAADSIDIAVGGASSGINRIKVQSALERLQVSEVDLEMERPHMAISPRQHTLLLNLAEVSEQEFNKFGGVIENGMVKFWLGVRIRISNRLATNAAGDLRVPLWVPSGMVVQPWAETRVRVSERSDKNYTMQIYAESRYGAVRYEEGRVIEIECNPTAAIT